MDIELLITNSKSANFIELIQLLDKDIDERYGELHILLVVSRLFMLL